MKRMVCFVLVFVLLIFALSVAASAWEAADSAVNSYSAFGGDDAVYTHEGSVYYDRFVEKYGQVYQYQELYTHTDSSGSPDWVVIQACYACCDPIEYSYVIHNRVVNPGGYYYPFSGGYAVYDVKADSFTALNETMLQKCDGLSAYVDSIGLGRPFGDVDNDGEVTIRDATLIQRSLVGIMELNDNVVYIGDFPKSQYEFSDFNTDGDTDVTDVTFIQRYLAGICDVYCQPIHSQTQQENTDALVYEFDMRSDRPSVSEYTDAVAYSSDPLPKYSYTAIPQIHRKHQFGAALVRSARQLKDETGLVREAYGDSFFEENALVIAWGQFYYDECYARVDGIYRDGKTLAVNFQYGYQFSFDQYGNPMGSPSAPLMCVLCPVSREDVKYVDQIIVVK